MEKRILKLICAAGNENAQEVERLCFVYSKAGFNMVDVCAKAEIIRAAANGIKRAGKENLVDICVSVGLQEDIHLMKAMVNKQKCIMCEKCISVCQQQALFIEDNKVLVDDKKCIGCSKCMDSCSENAILRVHKYKAPYTMLLPLLSEKIDCVEFHCSSSDENLILDSWNKIKSVFTGQLSICVDRSKLGDDKLIPLIKKMTEGHENIIVQADGKPMTGGSDDYKSNLQTVAFAELIRNSKLPVKLILSGGTNSKAAEFAKMCNVTIDGVALGSYARGLVKEYICAENFYENPVLIGNAIQRAKKLAESLTLYL